MPTTGAWWPSPPKIVSLRLEPWLTRKDLPVAFKGPATSARRDRIRVLCFTSALQQASQEPTEVNLCGASSQKLATKPVGKQERRSS